MFKLRLYVTAIIFLVTLVVGQNSKIFVIYGDDFVGLNLSQILSSASSSSQKGVTFETIIWRANLSSHDFKKIICSKIGEDGSTVYGVVDARVHGSTHSQLGFINSLGIPYFKLEFARNLLLKAIENLLYYMKFTDISFVVESETALNDTIFFVLGQTNLRTTGTDLTNPNAAMRLQKMRPSSTNYVSWGTTSELMNIYKRASSANILKDDVTWIFVHTDFDYDNFNQTQLRNTGRFFTFDTNTCCGLEKDGNCSCWKWTKGVNEYIVHTFFDLILEAISQIDSQTGPQKWNCEKKSPKNFSEHFYSVMTQITSQKKYFGFKHGSSQGSIISFPLKIDIKDKNKTHTVNVGEWRNSFKIDEDFTISKLKKIYRIGLVLGLPWAYFEYPNGTTTTDLIHSEDSDHLKLEGYFPSLLHELKKRMNFNYELVMDKSYGSRLNNGTWTGIVSKLVSGEIDICLANLIMTTEREEVIDFITPYIDMSGISIIIRKKKTAQSIFKFMTVLKLEVWIGTLIAVGVVTLLIWMLEKFSPYSYSNAKHLYPEGGRNFSFGESLWFSVTSLTPQGGGECPKALSGRILVAAYWLFIVLMLATFTSNLAAFLTVERLEKTIQSMEELIRHPKITYTVSDSTIVHQHFINMANAERILFEKWKNLTLNSGAQTQSEYRVWDYPIQEQYFHILQVINRVGTVKTPKEGFDRVEAATDGDFAFLHDTLEVKFHYYENCNFILVGQPLAEQPISVAVQQGSRLKNPLSKAILSLQKERYFEKLTKKYWNIAKRDLCPVLDESQGITLRSLGGIFLAALAGLALSMAVLAVEVWKQKQRGTRKDIVQKPHNFNSKDDIMKIGARTIRVTPMNSSSLATISNSETRSRRKSRLNFPLNY